MVETERNQSALEKWQRLKAEGKPITEHILNIIKAGLSAAPSKTRLIRNTFKLTNLHSCLRDAFEPLLKTHKKKRRFCIVPK